MNLDEGMFKDMMPSAQLRVDIPAQVILSQVAMYREEFLCYAEEGIKQAVMDAPGIIKVRAHQRCLEVIRESVDSYFKYGKGRQFIDELVREMLDEFIHAEEKGDE